MNKYIVLSAAALVISLAFGCQNCGYRTAHSSRYQSLVGTTRLASPQTNCRYYNACNACNTCNTCETQVLANNGQFCSNPYAQSGLYPQYAGQNASADVSLLDGTQQPIAQSETPLRWRSVTEVEQQYANSSVNTTSAGVASALGNPAFGSPAPAPVVDPQADYYRRDAAVGVNSALSRRPRPTPDMAPPYSSPYRNSSPRVAMGVESALTPGRPVPGTAPRYPDQYSNSSPRAAMGVDSALSVPNHPLPPQYSNRYPAASGGASSTMGNPSYGSLNADPMRWRHVTEEEQQYYNSPRRSAAGAPSNMTPGYGSPNPAYSNPSAQYPSSEAEPLAVPVYPENNADAVPAQTQEYSSTPEIDPNALPSLEPQNGAF